MPLNFVGDHRIKRTGADRHTVALRRENRSMVHEKPGRWSRKAGGRYSQCSFCTKLSVHEKWSLEAGGRYSRWSLKPGFTVDAFPYYRPDTSSGARPADRNRVLHAFVCRVSESVNFTEMKGKDDADISSSSVFWTIRKLMKYLRKEEGHLTTRKSGLVSRQAIDALDNVRPVDCHFNDRGKFSFFLSFFLSFIVTFSARSFSSVPISSSEQRSIRRTRSQSIRPAPAVEHAPHGKLCSSFDFCCP